MPINKEGRRNPRQPIEDIAKNLLKCQYYVSIARAIVCAAAEPGALRPRLASAMRMRA